MRCGRALWDSVLVARQHSGLAVAWCITTKPNCQSVVDVYYDLAETYSVYITRQVGIKEARGLPPVLSNFVFCQYTFWTQPPTTVPSVMSSNDTVIPLKRPDEVVVSFNHSQVRGKSFLHCLWQHFLSSVRACLSIRPFVRDVSAYMVCVDGFSSNILSVMHLRTEMKLFVLGSKVKGPAYFGPQMAKNRTRVLTHPTGGHQAEHCYGSSSCICDSVCGIHYWLLSESQLQFLLELSN